MRQTAFRLRHRELLASSGRDSESEPMIPLESNVNYVARRCSALTPALLLFVAALRTCLTSCPLNTHFPSPFLPRHSLMLGSWCLVLDVLRTHTHTLKTKQQTLRI